MKKGESLLSIMKKIPNRKPGALSLIKRLNPRLRNLDLIHPGQRIVLPYYENDGIGDVPAVEQQREFGARSYVIGKNDSITGIILAELNNSMDGRALTSAETIEAYRQIANLNPHIKDMNNLPVGGVLVLPSGNFPPAEASEGRQAESEAAPAVTNEKQTDEGADKNAQPMISPVLDGILTSIRPVIERMNGRVNASGSYFIPMQEGSRVTVNSSLIPSVELDDGTTVFLDYDNHLNDDFRQLIHQHWRNHHFLTQSELQSVVGALRGIIGHSRNYTMAHAEKQVLSVSGLEVSVFPDWIVVGSRKTAAGTYRQGIFLLAIDESSIPEDVKLFLERGGLAVTQIAAEAGTVQQQRNGSAARFIRDDLRGIEGISYAERLLTALGVKTVRRSQIDIFRQEINGFNLSVTAELTLVNAGRKLIINTKKLPGQFETILKNSGYELLTVGPNEKGRQLAESVLRGAGLPVSPGYYSVSIPGEGEHRRVDISFTALGSSTAAGKILLVDFDMPTWLLPRAYIGQDVVVIRYQ